MAGTIIESSKIKIRRGKNSERTRIILDTGELGYTIDTKRTYVGDGSTYGGVITGNMNFNNVSRTSSDTAIKAQLGDIVFDSNRLWSLSGNNASSTDSWLLLSPRVDNTTIRYDSNGILESVPGSVVLGSVGNGLGVASGVPYIDLDTDAETQALLGFDSGSNALEVGKLTDISHGSLGYQDTSTGTQHHSDATASAPGFMSSADKTKVDNVPNYPISDATEANKVMVAVNYSTANKINASRITGSITAEKSATTDAIKRYLGENASGLTQTLSGHEVTTPYNFLNREDIPGVIFDTAIPTAYISNQGQFPNIKLTGFADTVSTANYQDKAFLLPSADGTIYSIFIKNPSDSTALGVYTSAYPELNVVSADYNATDTTLRSNVITAINNIVNDIEERVFEAWEDSSTPGDIYVHNLVRGYTTTYDTTFAQGPGPGTYAIADGAVTYNNAAIATKTGSGQSAGDSSSGIIPAALFGWLKLNTTSQTLSARGTLSVHTIGAGGGAEFPTPSSALDGKYFLIYDTNFNRTCVWYDYSTGVSQPTISSTAYHRGYQTNFVEVDISTAGTSDDVANATVSALQANTYFSSVYTVAYASSTMTFTSVNPGYTDGVVNRIDVGIGSSTQFVPNSQSGTPNILSLNGAFYNVFKVTTPSTLPQDLIVIPGKAQQTLIDDNSGTQNVTSLLKFR